MKTIIKILLLLFIGFSAKANSLDSIPSGFPAPYSAAWYRIGTMMPDTLFVNPRRDTNFIPRFAGSQVFWQHPGLDSNIWISDGRRFFHYLKSGADVTNALGFTPIGNVTGFITAGANVTLTGLGTLASPYVIGSTAAGTGTVQQFIFNNGNGIVGTVTSPTVNPSLSLGTNITGVVYANGTGFSALGIGSGLTLVGNTLSANGGTSLTGVIVGDGSAFNAATIGAGLAYNTGTKTLSNTITNNNQLTNGNNYISNITGLVTAGTNVTVSGSGTAGSPYVINSSASGAITGSGNLSPLFTTSVVSNTITYSLSNAAGNTVFGNNTGSSAAPIYYVPNATTLNGWFGQTIGTVTSITGGSGILGGTITTSGTFKADTSLLGTQYDLTLKQAALSGTGFVIFSGTTPSYLTGTSSQFVKANGTLDGNFYFYNIATINTGTPGSNGITNVAGTLYPQLADSLHPGFQSATQFNYVNALMNGYYKDTTFIRFTPTTSAGAQYLSANNDTIYAKKFIAGTNFYIDSTTTPGALIFNVTGGGGGGTNANFGSGYRLVAATPTNIKTLFHGFGGTIDSTTNTNALTIIDTVTHISSLTNDAGYITASSTNTLTNKTISDSSNTITNVSLTAGVTGILPVANGGTNLSSYTSGGLFYASSSSVMGQITAPAHTGMKLTSTGTNTFAWQDTTAGGGGGGTVLPAGKIAFGSVSSTVTADSFALYNASTHTATFDSLGSKQVNISGFTAASLNIVNNFPGYSGIDIRNISTSGSAATRLRILDQNGVGLNIYNLGTTFSGAGSTSVLFSNAPGGLVISSDSTDWYFETHSVGHGADYAGHLFAITKHWSFSDETNPVDHNAEVFVNHTTKLNDSLIVNDQGHFYSLLAAGNYRDNSNYVEGVGWQFNTIKSTGALTAFKIDSGGVLIAPNYTNVSTTTGYTTKALYGQNAGVIGQGDIFDTKTGSRNPTQILFWSPSVSVPTSISNLAYDTIRNVLLVGARAAGTQQARLFVSDSLTMADKGSHYANISLENYQGNANYVEGVGYKLFTINATSQTFLALKIDSTGDLTPGGKLFSVSSTTSKASINIPNGTAPTSPTNGDVWGASNHLFAQLNGSTFQLDQQTLALVTAAGATTTNSITVRHIGGSGSAPTSGSLGANVTSVTVDPNSTDGNMQLKIITNAAVAGTICNITFANAYATAAFPVISPVDANSAGIGLSAGIVGGATTYFVVSGTIAVAGTYYFNIQTMGK